MDTSSDELGSDGEGSYDNENERRHDEDWLIKSFETMPLLAQSKSEFFRAPVGPSEADIAHATAMAMQTASAAREALEKRWAADGKAAIEKGLEQLQTLVVIEGGASRAVCEEVAPLFCMHTPVVAVGSPSPFCTRQYSDLNERIAGQGG